ncbi:hypothetical protein Q7P37_010072 [Cladosporium fusiforme]
MYRHICRAPSRSLSRHVCLTCRRHLHAAHAQRKDASEDWFENFNDLSVSTDKDRQRTAEEAANRKKAENTQATSDNALSKFASLKAQLDVSTTGKLQGDTKAGNHNRKAEGVATTPGDDSHKTTPAGSRQVYESVLASLIAERDGSSKVNGHNGEGGIDTGSAAAVDDARVKQGVVSPNSGTQDSNFGENLSILGKSRMTQKRPKWGGPTAAREAASSFKASFDTLRQADKVSPTRERPSTASSAKPWGFTAHQANAGFADLPGDLATSQELETAAISPKNEGSPASDPGSFHARLGFKRLRNMLFGNSKHANGGNEQAKDTKMLNAVNEGTSGIPTDSGGVPQPAKQIHNPPGTGTRRTRRARERNKQAKAARAARAAKAAKAAKAASATVGAPESPGTRPSVLAELIQVSESNGQPLSESMKGQQISEAMNAEPEARVEEGEREADEDESGLPRIEANDLQITALNIPQPPVPTLSFGLDRVLFNPGVTSLQDRHSRVYNFDPYLEQIMPVEEFDFNALQQYKTSSQDQSLSELAKTYEKKYVGSTSSMTSTLSHFHYLLSDWRDINLGMLSRNFPEQRPTFTGINRAPTAIFLRWKNGTYAIDADKEFDSGNILMMLGKSMEKLLTMSKSEYERYRKSDPREITEEERNAPEAYEYTTMGDFLMRSQLDAYDPRLPGTGMFDIKTRAIASIRMSTTDYKPMLGYEIHSQQGKWESYEREYYEMMRSTMLKYMLQARMGRMDGIFLSYHNVQRIFGFQYMPIAEIDRAIHGQIDRCLGDQEFKMSLHLLNKVIDEATARFPEKSLRFHFETRASPVTALYVFAEPMEEEEIDKIQATSKEKIAEFERKMMGIEPKEEDANANKDSPSTESQEAELAAAPNTDTHAPLYAATLLIGSSVNGVRVERPRRLKPSDSWTVEYLLKEMENPADAWATYAQCKSRRKKALAHAIMTDDEGGAEGIEDEPNYEMHDVDGNVRKFDNGYLEALRNLAEQGREFRRKLDEMEEGHEKVLWKEAALSEKPEKQSESKSAEPEITGVDDYLQWMYRDRQPKAEVESELKTDEPEITGVDDYLQWMYKDRKPH